MTSDGIRLSQLEEYRPPGGVLSRRAAKELAQKYRDAWLIQEWFEVRSRALVEYVTAAARAGVVRERLQPVLYAHMRKHGSIRVSDSRLQPRGRAGIRSRSLLPWYDRPRHSRRSKVTVRKVPSGGAIQVSHRDLVEVDTE